jgi:hypothetical protein
VKLCRDPDALDRDAAKIEALSFEANREEKGAGQAYVEMAAKLRRAAQAIRDGKIEGIPVR